MLLVLLIFSLITGHHGKTPAVFISSTFILNISFVMIMDVYYLDNRGRYLLILLLITSV